MSIWSTEPIAPEHRFEAWNAALSDSHLPWSLSRHTGHSFSARLRVLDTAALKLVTCTCDPCAGLRSPDRIRAGDDGYYGVLMVRSGRERVRQGNIVTEMDAGSTLIWDAGAQIEFEVLSPLEKCTFFVSKDALTRHGSAGGLPVGQLDSRRGFGALLHSRASALEALIDDFTSDDLERVGESLAQDLINATQGMNRPSFMVPRRELVLRVRRIIDAALCDPDLSPRVIARRVGVSTRYLHLLFQDQPETIGAYILRLRLDAVRADLSDPNLAQATITQIGFARGFSSSAHLSRAFRDRFGLSPRDYRNSATAPKLH